MSTRAVSGIRAGRSAARAGGLLAAAAVVLSACGAAGSTAAPAPSTAERAPTTTTTSSTATDPTSAAATTTAGGGSPAAATATTTTTTTTTAAAIAATAHGLSDGFTVGEFSAVSTQDWWVLGTAGNGALALARTVDGGRSWAAPVLPAALSRPVAGGPQSPAIAFSTPQDGSIVTAAGTYWVTSDGGAHWRDGNPSGAPVIAVAATPDASLTLLHSATGYALARGAAGAVGLTTVLAAGRLTATIPALATSGRTVVVVSGNRTLISTDDGQTFRTVSGPCTADLGGQVSVAATTVVAWCATGMDGSGWISTDGGSHFAAVPGAEGANATAAAPTGSGGALVWADPVRGVQLRGAAGTRVSGRTMYRVTWVGFSSPTAGFAIAGASATGPALLWQTLDSGRSWHAVAID
jgi:photosystem II stability/assembly factor-like uncharacterized protein